MAKTVLEFEKPIVELEAKLEEMKRLSEKVNIESEIIKIEEKVRELKEGIYKDLTRWQRVQLARHPDRPYTLDYIYSMTSNFIELHGDSFWILIVIFSPVTSDFRFDSLYINMRMIINS